MLLRRLKAVPKVYWLATLIGLAAGLLIAYVWPVGVTFSYSSATCVGHPSIAPSLLDEDSREYEAEPVSVMKIGSVPVISRGICFTPVAMPKPGNYTVKLSMAGMPFIMKSVNIHVPDHPVVSAIQLKDPVPVSKKLVFALSREDTLFSYRLTVGEETINCVPQSLSIGCDLEKLGLKQGGTYNLRLERYFNDALVETVMETGIRTLPEVVLEASTIKPNGTVYSKPRSLTMRFNKEIESAEVELIEVGDKSNQIEATIVIKEKEVRLSWPDELERRKTYQVALKHIKGKDGSLLTTPGSFKFKTSGGPKVKGIDIGTYNVSPGTVATLTFDQSLEKDQDISKAITVTGGAKLLSRQGNKVTIGFTGVHRCGNVVITVSDDLISSYGISGGSKWQYTTRTTCHTVSSIGTSRSGRPIYSYSFGSGSKTIVYTGAIHGDEVSTRALMMRWIDALEGNPQAIPSGKRVIVIPTINPDGFAVGSRTNAKNVDLNRNFATSDWKKDITTVTNKPFPGGGGKSPLSEPESKALANYIASIKPALVLSYHSIGGLLMANQAGSSTSLAKRYASLSGYSNATGSSGGFEYSISGTADDYYAEKLGVPSILIELGSHTYHQFERNQSAMWAMLREI